MMKLFFQRRSYGQVMAVVVHLVTQVRFTGHLSFAVAVEKFLQAHGLLVFKQGYQALGDDHRA